MASKYTSGYQLSQWEAGDKVLRTDFNEDNAKIDAALKALNEKKMPQISCGWYWGDGQATQKINVGFSPDGVLVFCNAQFNGSTRSVYGGYTTTGCTLALTVGSQTYDALHTNDTGFTAYETATGDPNAAVHCNMKGVAYAYIAFND